MNIQEVLCKIQTELVAPKGQYNDFGKYKYRNIEDLTEALKPLLKECGAALVMSDDIVHVTGRFYVKATVALWLDGDSVEATGWAREAESKKGMDASQITGSCSSYARKYAFCGLFCIDDGKDADSRDNKEQKPECKLSADWEIVFDALNLRTVEEIQAWRKKNGKAILATVIDPIEKKKLKGFLDDNEKLAGEDSK